jgi:peroxiredoxin
LSRVGPGSPAPDFTTRNQHGEPVRLSALRGNPVILVFYPFAFTSVCTGELAALQRQSAEFQAFGARVLALSTDTMYALRVFGDQEGLGFDLLTDHWPHGAIAQAYGVFDPELGCALRGSFLVATDGLVRWRVVNQVGEPRDITEHLSALQRFAGPPHR